MKNGSGTLIIAPAGGQNSYSGTTLLNAGTLQLGATKRATQRQHRATQWRSVEHRIRRGLQRYGRRLDLAASSTVALGTGHHSITFSGITGTPTGVLTITGWLGTRGVSGTAGDILFTGVGGTPNSTYAAFLATVDFAGYEIGDAAFILNSGSTYELVPAPVPEPAAVLGIAVSALLVGVAFRRAGRKCCAAT